MPNLKRNCVIIPVHKSNINEDDAISLKACYRHLSEYDCFLVYPQGMNTDQYIAIYQSLKLKPVNPAWLSSIQNYNIMKADAEFYKIFSEYEFMFTYELDSYIFSSDLESYKVFEYDYIGAPFFEGYLDAKSDAGFIAGGNSGFSIRNIQSCLKVLNLMDRYKMHWKFYKLFFAKFPALKFHLNRITKGKYDIFINGKLDFYFIRHHTNEDMVWSQIVPQLFPFYKVADPITSLNFSFEANPQRLFEINGNKLPLGCHGWPKNKFFWKNYINLNSK